jgi:hypothetical protein
MRLDAWSEAEAAIYRRLLTILGGTDKVTAFLGYLPPVPNAWAFNTGEGPGVEELWSIDPDAIHMDAEVVGRFAKRADAQALFTKLITAQVLTFSGDDALANVTLFRIREGGAPVIELDQVPIGNDGNTKAWLYTIAIGCELTYACDWRDGT